MPHNEERFGYPYKCKWQLHWLYNKQQTENINTRINTQIQTQTASSSHTLKSTRGAIRGLLLKSRIWKQTRGLGTMWREGLFASQEEVVSERDVRWCLLEEWTEDEGKDVEIQNRWKTKVLFMFLRNDHFTKPLAFWHVRWMCTEAQWQLTPLINTQHCGRWFSICVALAQRLPKPSCAYTHHI